MEDRVEEEVKEDVHRNEDDYYEDVIKKLYRPAVKTIPTMGAAITQTEINFDVEPAPEPEPAVVTPPEPEPEEEDKDTEPTILKKWRNWINNFMKDIPE